MSSAAIKGVSEALDYDAAEHMLAAADATNTPVFSLKDVYALACEAAARLPLGDEACPESAGTVMAQHTSTIILPKAA